MQEEIESFIRYAHIFSGAISLISGILALVLSPNVNRHRPLGKVFFYSMVVVFITAVILAIHGGIGFLLCVAILSFFSVVIDVRSLRFLKGSVPGLIDVVIVASLILAGGYLTFIGLRAGANGINEGAVLYSVFGVAMLFYGASVYRQLLRIKPGDIMWFTVHKSNMGAALIATLTAFSTTTMSWLPSILEWFWPTIVFSPILGYFIKKSKQNITSNEGK